MIENHYNTHDHICSKIIKEILCYLIKKTQVTIMKPILEVKDLILLEKEILLRQAKII